MSWLSTLSGLGPTDLLILAAICFLAGLVRGFSGFALSAVAMAAGTSILPPIALIPVLWWLEMTASLMMLRGGWKDADRRIVIGLVLASAIGTPLGIALTTSLPVDVSKLIALALVVTLSITQLGKIRLAFLATKPGLYSAGLMAGIVTGLAGIGGMVIALFVLAQNTPARKMRAALVLFLFLSSIISMITYLAFGVMDQTAALRGLIFIAPTAIGVILGQQLFTERFEPYYKPFCLILLITLASLSILRQIL
ncbi:MAG: sulfite exporter TauE/SafE family protein [Paracoccaceae bacterium]